MGAKYTVFVPVHNGGEHVKNCIQSVREQTLRDFELVVLENASADGTHEWLTTLRDPRIRLVPSRALLPIEENWGRALRLHKNELMTFFGHDDLMDPNYLEVMDGLVRRDPNAGLYFAHFRYINEKGSLLRSCRPMPERETAAGYLQALFSRQRDTYGTGYLYRSCWYEEVGGIPRWPHLVFADDALWLMLMESSWKATAPEECFACRVHAERYGQGVNWRSWAGGLRPYIQFLQEFAARDRAFAAVLADCAPEYFLEWCNSLHERALVEATEQGRKLDPADVAPLADAIRAIAPQAWAQYIGNPRYQFRRRALLNRFALTRRLYRQYRLLRYGPGGRLRNC